MGIIFSILDLEEGQDTHEALFLWSHLVPIYYVDFESGLKLINKRTSYQMNVTSCSIMRINLQHKFLVTLSMNEFLLVFEFIHGKCHKKEVIDHDCKHNKRLFL